MENRCRALLKQIICFSPENGSISLMLDAWVKSMNPQRANWLSVLNELERLNHPLYFEEKDVEISLNLMICKGQRKGHELDTIDLLNSCLSLPSTSWSTATENGEPCRKSMEKRKANQVQVKLSVEKEGVLDINGGD
ncbi:pentatricopeptide repeat-containing protein [Forsythia ovata]|uniref:Pentatricopeptide repeat-containing protein n=1 Tax=Forsythia ovata TaxID=205694 RepID=A0ABD1WW47_9LAMI